MISVSLLLSYILICQILTGIKFYHNFHLNSFNFKVLNTEHQVLFNI